MLVNPILLSLSPLSISSEKSYSTFEFTRSRTCIDYYLTNDGSITNEIDFVERNPRRDSRIRCSASIFEIRKTKQIPSDFYTFSLLPRLALDSESLFFYASSMRTHIYHNHLRLSICHVPIALIFQQCPADTFLFFIMLFQFLDTQNFIRSVTCTRVFPVVHPISRKHFISRLKRFYYSLIKVSDSQ